MSARNAPREPRRNEGIRALEVRVIDESGVSLGVMAIEDALAIAEERELDLVELGADAVPPVCRLLDYHKEKFRAERAQRAAKHRTVAQGHVSEVQLRPAIAVHDMLTKAKIADRALAKGHRVRVIAILHGRHISRPEVAHDLLSRFCEMVTHPKDIEVGNGSERRIVWVLKPTHHASSEISHEAVDGESAAA
jgi:translation initiation factor IF-3